MTESTEDLVLNVPTPAVSFSELPTPCNNDGTAGASASTLKNTRHRGSSHGGFVGKKSSDVTGQKMRKRNRTTSDCDGDDLDYRIDMNMVDFPCPPHLDSFKPHFSFHLCTSLLGTLENMRILLH
jgi:hypothetical protein